MSKRIISIGMLHKLSFVEDYAKAHDMEHINIHNVYDPDEIFRIVLSEQYDYICFYLQDIDGVDSTIALMFKKLKSSINTNTKIIVNAQGYLPASNLIIKIRESGIQDFIFENNLRDQKNIFEKLIQGESIESEIPRDISNASIFKEEEQFAVVEPRNYKTIAVISKTNRIGTSTVAIQLTKYLQFLGFKACYIQINTSNWVQAHAEWFDDLVDHDEEIGKVIFNDVDMYYKPEHINTVLSSNYDYIIYDYGTTTNVSFFEKDIKIGVAGTSPTEMNDTENLINEYYEADLFFAFNFIPEPEREDLLDMMAEKASVTFFLNNCPDPFFLSPQNIESYKIFNFVSDDETSELSVKEKPKRKRFFKR